MVVITKVLSLLPLGRKFLVKTKERIIFTGVTIRDFLMDVLYRL